MRSTTKYRTKRQMMKYGNKVQKKCEKWESDKIMVRVGVAMEIGNMMSVMK